MIYNYYYNTISTHYLSCRKPKGGGKWLFSENINNREVGLNLNRIWESLSSILDDSRFASHLVFHPIEINKISTLYIAREGEKEKNSSIDINNNNNIAEKIT